MKSYVSKLSSPLLLSPPINLYNFSISEILSSLSHKRCLSAKNSPYNQTSIEKFNSAIRNSKERSNKEERTNKEGAGRNAYLKFESKIDFKKHIKSIR